MKLSDGFDARRLRPKGPSNWRLRFGAALAALLATLGVLLSMAGAASLLGRPPALASQTLPSPKHASNTPQTRTKKDGADVGFIRFSR